MKPSNTASADHGVLNPITLRYKVKSLEQLFVNQREEENKLTKRISNILSISAWCLLLYYSRLFLENTFATLVYPVAFVICPYFTFMIVVTFIKRLRFLSQPLCAFGNFLTGTTIALLGVSAIKDPQLVTIFFCGSIVFAFFIIPLRFYIAVITTLTYVLIYHVLLFGFYRYSLDNTVLALLSVWFFELVSVARGYISEKNVRRVFMQNMIIRNQHDIILQEKEKSEALLKQRLYHLEKLASLGSAVAGVAHEVNNPNNSLMLDIGILRKTLEGFFPVLDESVRDRRDFEISGIPYAEIKQEIGVLTDRMKRNSERIKRIVADMRSFTKNEVVMSETVLLNEVVKSAVSVADHFIRKCTKNFRLSLGENIPAIKGNIQYMEQVIINLVKNACQALPDYEKGVYVSTAFDEKTKNIVFAIRDEGKGMDDETLKNIFTPFFTTKGREGTGLGLSICNNIVKTHGGKIEVESVVGQGTTIRVLLLPSPSA